MTVILRNYKEADFQAFHALVSDYDVVKMTASWPHPADEAFSRKRFSSASVQSGLVKAIEVDGEFAGGVGLVDGEIGYFLSPAFWGQGVMTQAVALRLAEHFADPSHSLVKSCVWRDNPASTRVLIKNGFRLTGEGQEHCVARQCDLDAEYFELTRERWQTARGAA